MEHFRILDHVRIPEHVRILERVRIAEHLGIAEHVRIALLPCVGFLSSRFRWEGSVELCLELFRNSFRLSV